MSNGLRPAKFDSKISINRRECSLTAYRLSCSFRNRFPEFVHSLEHDGFQQKWNHWTVLLWFPIVIRTLIMHNGSFYFILNVCTLLSFILFWIRWKERCIWTENGNTYKVWTENVQGFGFIVIRQPISKSPCWVVFEDSEDHSDIKMNPTIYILNQNELIWNSACNLPTNSSGASPFGNRLRCVPPKYRLTGLEVQHMNKANV